MEVPLDVGSKCYHYVVIKFLKYYREKITLYLQLHLQFSLNHILIMFFLFELVKHLTNYL